MVYLKPLLEDLTFVLCIHIVQCQAFSSFDNGKISCSLGSDGIHSYQDTCSVTCNAGYTLSGSDTRMCLSNGSWSGMDGRCERGKVNYQCIILVYLWVHIMQLIHVFHYIHKDHGINMV